MEIEQSPTYAAFGIKIRNATNDDLQTLGNIYYDSIDEITLVDCNIDIYAFLSGIRLHHPRIYE